ncbi:hypothetical protein [Achromobacter phage Motura]|uniref:Uncharacterized protein n=1 Tax=Achromobacter phage Motura TaxID=2591403 RepID=A0A514CSR8_9CAUD|nr:hypothetical protein H1O15_gp279 [Achromobacter phage Motura]QDH83527.1 hypothetical protein [Achromobacter phage Motura]
MAKLNMVQREPATPSAKRVFAHQDLPLDKMVVSVTRAQNIFACIGAYIDSKAEKWTKDHGELAAFHESQDDDLSNDLELLNKIWYEYLRMSILVKVGITYDDYLRDYPEYFENANSQKDPHVRVEQLRANSMHSWVRNAISEASEAADIHTWDRDRSYTRHDSTPQVYRPPLSEYRTDTLPPIRVYGRPYKPNVAHMVQKKWAGYADDAAVAEYAVQDFAVGREHATMFRDVENGSLFTKWEEEYEQHIRQFNARWADLRNILREALERIAFVSGEASVAFEQKQKEKQEQEARAAAAEAARKIAEENRPAVSVVERGVIGITLFLVVAYFGYQYIKPYI